MKNADKLVDPMANRPSVEEEDWNISAWPLEDEDAAEEMFMDQIEQHGCPFYWLYADNPWLSNDN